MFFEYCLFFILRYIHLKTKKAGTPIIKPGIPHDIISKINPNMTKQIIMILTPANNEPKHVVNNLKAIYATKNAAINAII